MELSLDEIIQKKRFGGAASKYAQKKAGLSSRINNKTQFKATNRITDARNKIVQKNRAKIRDARDKLVEISRNNDARHRLQHRQQYRHQHPQPHQHPHPHPHQHVKNGKVPYRNGHLNGGQSSLHKSGNHLKPKMSPYRLRQTNMVEVPRGYIDYDNMERMEEEEYAAASRLSRTVKNDISYDLYVDSRVKTPPASRCLDSWGSDHFDPFDMYEPQSRHERQRSPKLPPPPPKGILRSSIREHSPTDLYNRRYIPQPSSHLSYEMRSRLEHAPDPHASMGIFSNPLKGSTSSSGYRIVVSNLHSSVTQSDIKELFEDIGDLYDSRIVRPGTAEVIYKSLSDAEKAVETYHNRQLDGQPMKCLLVHPRASNKPTAPAINSSSSSSRLTSGKTPLEIDIDALHKVLFRRH